MVRYIALLRGINISGKNKISMQKLKEYFEELSFHEVKTYLNSGNVIFSTPETNISDITSSIESMIKKTFDLNIPVLVISQKSLQNALQKEPSWWNSKNKDIYDNLIFILPPATFKDVYDNLGRPNDQYERIENVENFIFWSFDRKNYQKTYWWAKTASSTISTQLTIRTANTVKKNNKFIESKVNMKTTSKILKIINILFLILTLIFLIVQWNQIPMQIPTHYDLYGTMDNYGQKNSLIGFFIIELVIYLLLKGIQWIVKLAINSSDTKKSFKQYISFIAESFIFVSNFSFSMLIYHMVTSSNISFWLTFGPLVLAILIICFTFFKFETC